MYISTVFTRDCFKLKQKINIFHLENKLVIKIENTLSLFYIDVLTDWTYDYRAFKTKKCTNM